MAKVLVTGVAGFIGSTLADRLLAEGHEVVGVDSFEDYYPRSMKAPNLAQARDSARFELIDGTLLDLGVQTKEHGCAPLLRRRIRQCDYLYHLAAQPGVRGSWGRSFRTYADNNVLATQLLLEECKGAGLKKLIYASSSSVYGDSPRLPLREDGPCAPLSPYGVTKLAAEHLCALYLRNHGVPAVALRFFTVYGPRQRPDMAFHRFILAGLAGDHIDVFGDGEQTRDFTYVDDIVSGLVAAMDAAEGMVMNLGGGSRISLRSALQTLELATGLPMRLRLHEQQAGDVRDTWADISLAQKTLSFSPSTTLAEGLGREYEWLLALRAAAPDG